MDACEAKKRRVQREIIDATQSALLALGALGRTPQSFAAGVLLGEMVDRVVYTVDPPEASGPPIKPSLLRRIVQGLGATTPARAGAGRPCLRAETELVDVEVLDAVPSGADSFEPVPVEVRPRRGGRPRSCGRAGASKHRSSRYRC